MDPMLIKPVLYHPPPEAWSRHYSLASHNPALKISYEYRSAYNQTLSSHSDHDYPIVRLLDFLPFREDYGQRFDSLDPLPVQCSRLSHAYLVYRLKGHIPRVLIEWFALNPKMSLAWYGLRSMSHPILKGFFW